MQELDADLLRGGCGPVQFQRCGLNGTCKGLGGALVEDLFGGSADCNPADPSQICFAAVGAEAFARQSGEGEHEVLEHGGVKSEDVQVEVKGLAWSNDAAVEMTGAEDKRAGRVCESARAITLSGRSED